MDKCRDQFEEWFYKELSVAGGVYHLAWQAWQASRQALVVELPPQHEAAYRGYDSVELRYALKDAGIKWTE